MKISCRLCGSDADKTHDARILEKHTISFFLCPRCDLLQTEPPFWLTEAYSSPISMLDSGLMHRNVMVCRRVAIFLYRHGLEKTRGMDFAGGYGVLVRMLRDLGLNFFWSDPYSPNLVARGFEAIPEERYEIITAFEVLEHFDEPARQIGSILEGLAPDILLFETTLREDGSVPPPDWKYYALETGQHVAFYSLATLAFISARFGYSFWREGRLLILSKSPRTSRIRGWRKFPHALFKTYLPDSIPFIRRDRETMEGILRTSRNGDAGSSKRIS